MYLGRGSLPSLLPANMSRAPCVSSPYPASRPHLAFPHNVGMALGPRSGPHSPHLLQSLPASHRTLLRVTHTGPGLGKGRTASSSSAWSHHGGDKMIHPSCLSLPRTEESFPWKKVATGSLGHALQYGLGRLSWPDW